MLFAMAFHHVVLVRFDCDFRVVCFFVYEFSFLTLFSFQLAIDSFRLLQMFWQVL